MHRTDATRGGRRNHLLDLFRIIFSILVLLAHAPELTDGNNSRELFSRWTHSSVSFGRVGVDGFFVLSGFLILQSWKQNPEFLNFLRKRVLRIVPGYVVAMLVSTAVVGLLAPGVPHFFSHLGMDYVKSLIALSTPSTPPVLPGRPLAMVNAAVWTIPYEFRCYLIVAVFGVCGLLRRSAVWLACTVVLSGIAMSSLPITYFHWPERLFQVVGDPHHVFQLTAVYFIGGCFYFFREWIKFRPMFASIAAALMVVLLVIDVSRFEPLIVFFGGYLLLYLSHVTEASWMSKVPDISYGIYLYGWPVEILWIWYFHSSPWVTFAASTVICAGLGWLSWHFVERPMLKLKRRSTAPLPAA
jgi:peptidoglycan/LPS O-acetylase OafA/YrhL